MPERPRPTDIVTQLRDIWERLRTLERSLGRVIDRRIDVLPAVATSGDHDSLTGVDADDHHAQSHGRSDHTTAIIVEDEGVGLGDFLTLNFAGAGVSAVDAGGGEATITISGGGGGGHIIREDGVDLTARAGLNFVEGLIATDDAVGDESDVNIDWAEAGDLSGNVDIGDAAAAGASTEVPRADHQHGFPAPGAGYPLDVAAAEADGVATTPARSDHVHAHGTGYLADAHHAQTHSSSDHDTAETGDLAAIAAAAAAGSNPEVPFADHVHAHGSGYLPDAHHSQAHGVSDHTTAVSIEDEGIAQGDALTLDFVGDSVVATVAAGTATITISGGAEPTVSDWFLS